MSSASNSHQSSLPERANAGSSWCMGMRRMFGSAERSTSSSPANSSSTFPAFSGLLDTARAHLKPGGRLVLTTPNAFAVSNFVYRIGGRPRVNAEHTCWFCEDTIATLLERHGFEVEDVSYLKHTTPGRVRAAVAGLVRSVLPERLAQNTLLAVARAR